jgi:hypothetical protein
MMDSEAPGASLVRVSSPCYCPRLAAFLRSVPGAEGQVCSAVRFRSHRHLSAQP